MGGSQKDQGERRGLGRKARLIPININRRQRQVFMPTLLATSCFEINESDTGNIVLLSILTFRILAVRAFLDSLKAVGGTKSGYESTGN